MDIIVFATLALVIFAALSLAFAPDSRDTRRLLDRHGTWAVLVA